MLALAPLAAGLCAPGSTTALQRSPRPLCARLRPALYASAPRMMAASEEEEEEEAAPRTGKSEVFGEMSEEAQAAFLQQLAQLSSRCPSASP